MRHTREQWVDIKGYEGIYQVSNCGHIRSLDRYVKHSNGGQKLLKGKQTKARINYKTGYLEVGLSKQGKQTYYLVHRLVAQAFISNPQNLPVVNHVDGNKLNNSIENLEWVTQQFNVKHALNIGLSKNNMTQEVWLASIEARRRPVRCIEDDITFDSVADAARYYEVDSSRIVAVCKGRCKTTRNKHFEYTEKGGNI